MNQQIDEIFKVRDQAVTEKNKALFMSTQIDEIPRSGSEGYLKTAQLESSVLHAYQDDNDPNLWIALVKEKYFNQDMYYHRGYLLYRLQQRDDGLKISEIVW